MDDNHIPGGNKIEVPSSWSQAIPRQRDGDATYLHCSGGFRAAQHDGDMWHIEPVLHDGIARASGLLDRDVLQKFLRQYDFRAIAFQHLGWTKGQYSSGWSPIVMGQSSHMQSPADFWGHIASNLSKFRTRERLSQSGEISHQTLSALIDDKKDIERIPRYISLSLRSIDINVENIAEFYNEQLVNIISSKNFLGKRYGGHYDQILFSHVHAFFTHLGAARDYLGSFLALRMGKNPYKVDDMKRFVSTLRQSGDLSDPILQILLSKGYIVPKPCSDKFCLSGWMEEATNVRNEFVHRRPYGSKFVEQMGYVHAIDKQCGIYKYIRPITSPRGDLDLLDTIIYHYRRLSQLFREAAFASGLDTAMLTLTDRDIISVNIEKRRD